jgi:signal peptidase I
VDSDTPDVQRVGVLESPRGLAFDAAPGHKDWMSPTPPVTGVIVGDTVEPMSRRAGEGPGAAREQPGQEPDSPDGSVTKHRRSFLRELPVIVVTALVISLLIKTFLVQAFFIPSGSMEQTLHGCPGCLGDRVLVSKLSSHTSGIRRGDIVVFRDSSGWLPEVSPTPGLRNRIHEALTFIGLAPSSTESDLIKRVIGVGGDTVEGRGGKVYVDGALLAEPYVFPGNSPSQDDFTVTVPAGKLWMMGDHRAESADSRAHRTGPGNGFVPESDVIGRAFVIVWPLDRAALLHRPATFDQPALAGAR